MENRQRLKPQHTTKRTSGLPKQTRTKMQTRKHNIRKNIQILPIHTNMQQMPKKKQKSQLENVEQYNINREEQYNILMRG